MQVVIKRPDGGVSIMVLQGLAAEAHELAPEYLDMIVQAEISQWPKEDQGAVVSWRAMPDDAIPTDRTFRAAWSDTSKELVVDQDMAKCRNIWRDHMRAARAPKLAALDVEVMRAIEAGDDTKAIADKKQALRDVTKAAEIEAATTPEELKAVWPAILADR